MLADCGDCLNVVCLQVTRLADELLLQCRMLAIHKVVSKRVWLVDCASIKHLQLCFHGWAGLCTGMRLKDERLAFDTISEDHKALVAQIQDLQKVNQAISDEMVAENKRHASKAIVLVMQECLNGAVRYGWSQWIAFQQSSKQLEQSDQVQQEQLAAASHQKQSQYVGGSKRLAAVLQAWDKAGLLYGLQAWVRVAQLNKSARSLAQSAQGELRSKEERAQQMEAERAKHEEVLMLHSDTA